MNSLTVLGTIKAPHVECHVLLGKCLLTWVVPLFFLEI